MHLSKLWSGTGALVAFGGLQLILDANTTDSHGWNEEIKSENLGRVGQNIRQGI